MTDEATYQIVFEKKAGKRAYLCTGADGEHYVADKQKDAAKFNSHYEATQVMAREYRIAVGTPRVVKQPRMSKAVHRLTAKKIEKLKDPGRFHDGDGLYLQITPSGSRSWLLRYQRGGKEHMFGLGPLRTFSLKEARERAREVRQQVKDGEDPIEALKAKRQQGKREIAKRTTFRKAAEDYLKTHEGEWRNEVHRRQWRQTLDK
jgi:hypothetical protein